LRKNYLAKKELKEKIDKQIKSINSLLCFDGGGIKLETFKKNSLVLSFTGKCVECDFSSLTAKNCIKKELNERFPEIENIKIIK